MNASRTGRRGFTLVELLVALTVAGVVVLLAHRVFGAATDAGRALLAQQTLLDREANGVRWLRAALGSVEAGEGAGAFNGRRNSVDFSTWLQTPRLWFERTRVVVERVDRRLVARVGAASEVTLREGVASLELDYLLELGERSEWAPEWISPITNPVAVRARISYLPDAGRVPADTLLFVVGVRG